nr:carbohydrate kinase [uncultured Mucilaginibacter sp.]
MKNVNTSVVCFGEVLWDVLPTGRIPGGAPMNVAYHLHKLGVNSQVISSIGEDEAGTNLMAFLKAVGLPTDYIQVNQQYATSEVLASINDHNEVSYEIVYPVAWDKIAWHLQLAEMVSKADAFVFGSLSSRDNVSRETLLRLLDVANYRVFDVNLRAPHYTVDLVTDLLNRADMVKLNTSELMQIAQWYDANCQTEAACIELLFRKFNVREILITKGGTGASYYTVDYRYDYPAYKISVADTVGSGDAFLAAFLAMKLNDEPVEVALDYAVAMGAFITSQSGACPEYSRYDLGRFIWKKKLFNQNPNLTDHELIAS